MTWDAELVVCVHCLGYGAVLFIIHRVIILNHTFCHAAWLEKPSSRASFGKYEEPRERERERESCVIHYNPFLFGELALLYDKRMALMMGFITVTFPKYIFPPNMWIRCVYKANDKLIDRSRIPACIDWLIIWLRDQWFNQCMGYGYGLFIPNK